MAEGQNVKQATSNPQNAVTLRTNKPGSVTKQDVEDMRRARITDDEIIGILTKGYGMSRYQARGMVARRIPGSTSEIEKMDSHRVYQAIRGLNNFAVNVKDKGDAFILDFDHNDFSTHGKRSPEVDRIAKFLTSMGATCYIDKNRITAYKNKQS